MIDGFETQPYPLFAVWVLSGQWEPIVCRVVGWHAESHSERFMLRPVLEVGNKAFASSNGETVSIFDTAAEAERQAPILAKAARSAMEFESPAH
jgi:hypothetical protein